MCGPLAAAACGAHRERARSGLFYLALGRVAALIVVGIALGASAHVMHEKLSVSREMLRWLQALSALVAGIYCAAFGWRLFTRKREDRNTWVPATQLVRPSDDRALAQTTQSTARWRSRGIGIGAGLVLLPCSVLWLAGALALSQASPLYSGALLGAFALASTPGLALGAGVGVPLIARLHSGAGARYVLAALAGIVAITLLWRGASQVLDAGAGDVEQSGSCPLHPNMP